MLAAIVAFVGFMGVAGINKLSAEMNDMYENNLKPINYLSDTMILYQRVRVNIRDMTFIATAPEENAEYEEKLTGLKGEIQATLDEYSNTKLTDQETVVYKELPSALEEYYLLLDQAIEIARKNDVQAYQKIQPKFTESGDKVQSILQELIDINEELAQQKDREGESMAASSRNLTLFIISLAVILSIGLGYFIARIIGGPLGRVVDVVSAVAQGDLSEQVEINRKDEIGRLGNEINRMVDNLKGLVSSVKQNSEQVAAASEELSASAEQTSKATEQISTAVLQAADGTESQTRSVQEASQSINKMSDGIQQVSTASQSVSSAVNLTLDKAEEGKTSVQTAVGQMTRINETVHKLGTVIVELGEHSKKIGSITEVITGISEQTNLLALNAAIEAARAGESGKGFAVVANEVRKLAEQSSKSAQEISTLVTWIQKETSNAVSSMEKAKNEVDEGIEVVETAGGSFEQIYQSISDVASQAQKVSTAIEQVAAGSKEIVRAVDSIVQVTEETAAGTQEVSAATEEQLASMEDISQSAFSLSRMAEELQEKVSTFKISK